MYAAPPPTEAEQWARLVDTFNDLRDLVETHRLETLDEALAGKPTWFDPSVGVHVRPWLLIPYRKTYADSDHQQSLVQDHFDRARSLIPELEKMFEQRQPTLEFLTTWGAFCASAAVVQTVYFSENDDLFGERGSKVGSEIADKTPQRIWVAHLLLRQLSANRTRKQAQHDVATAIQKMLDGGVFPDGFDRNWFQRILGTGGELGSSFTKNLSSKVLVSLVSQDADIPPTDISIPRT